MFKLTTFKCDHSMSLLFLASSSWCNCWGFFAKGRYNGSPITVVCHDKTDWQDHAASPNVKPLTKRPKNSFTDGVPARNGSSTQPIVTVAPLASNGPTQCWLEERIVSAL